jgi:hypothetical protein
MEFIFYTILHRTLELWQFEKNPRSNRLPCKEPVKYILHHRNPHKVILRTCSKGRYDIYIVVHSFQKIGPVG